jgi:hypothetical protein
MSQDSRRVVNRHDKGRGSTALPDFAMQQKCCTAQKFALCDAYPSMNGIQGYPSMNGIQG